MQGTVGIHVVTPVEMAPVGGHAQRLFELVQCDRNIDLGMGADFHGDDNGVLHTSAHLSSCGSVTFTGRHDRLPWRQDHSE